MKDCLLIEKMTCPQDNIVSRMEFKRLATYRDLQIEVTKMWKLQMAIASVVIGALGMIKKGTDKHITKIPGDTTISERQKITLGGTAHILHKHLTISNILSGSLNLTLPMHRKPPLPCSFHS